jgi:AcrR family transcriptional regulator
MGTTTGLRERKKEKTRTQLTDAAFRLFAEQGFDGTTIEQIVDQVEVSPRTFFRYFDSKEDVVIGFFDDIGQELRDLLEARPAEEAPFTAVSEALRSLADMYIADESRVVAAKRLSHETPSIRARLLDKHARWENGLTEGLGRRMEVDPDRDPRPRLIAAVSLAAFSTAVGDWCSTGGRSNLHARVDDALAVVGAGLATTPS